MAEGHARFAKGLTGHWKRRKKSMQEETKTDYAAIAVKRWPRADIAGRGPHAITFRCDGRLVVRLFETFSSAVVMRDMRCTARMCQSAHCYLKLQPEKPPAPVFHRQPHWMRLRDRFEEKQ
jgi:hypothetical protein